MSFIAEFTDPRLVAIYETVNAYADDKQPRFYRELAAELGIVSIIDIGCGTGLIARELAGHGYDVVGVDPAQAMTEAARRLPHGELIRWVVGDTSQLGSAVANLAIMTGHVAQFFISDTSWHATLAALRRSLRPGGRLAFESRNPGAREWERWTRDASWFVDDPAAGKIEVWSETHDVRDGVVSYANHYAFASGERLESPNRLRFRGEEELRRSLGDAGFAVERVYGDWQRGPAGPESPELIIVAAR